MQMSGKTAGVIVAAVTGAAAGTMIALVSTPKKTACRKVNNFAKSTSRVLDTAGTIFISMADMLK
ncbi:MAG: hypothetical protein IJ391_01730 [Clostridia bacterium]|nr:hypothetical protein [Clostridia bacterium]